MGRAHLDAVAPVVGVEGPPGHRRDLAGVVGGGEAREDVGAQGGDDLFGGGGAGEHDGLDTRTHAAQLLQKGQVLPHRRDRARDDEVVGVAAQPAQGMGFPDGVVERASGQGRIAAQARAQGRVGVDQEDPRLPRAHFRASPAAIRSRYSRALAEMAAVSRVMRRLSSMSTRPLTTDVTTSLPFRE